MTIRSATKIDPDHKSGGYSKGCRCAGCRAVHNAKQVPYAAAAYQRKKAELAELRQLKADVLALVAGLSEPAR